LTISVSLDYHRFMGFRAILRQRLRLGLLLLIVSLFLIEVALPKMVWCHHLQGTAHLEFRLSESECPCDRCEENSEEPRPGLLDRTLGQSSWKAKNCWHETIFSDVGRPSLQNPPQKIVSLKHWLVQCLSPVFPEKWDLVPASLPPASRHLFYCGLSPGEVFRC
jgi:hypothetical protein